MSTRINFLYRDASNYKQAGSITIGDDLTDEQRATIAATLDDGQFFIPEQVGFPNPRDQFEKLSEDDHCWCELEPAYAFEDDESQPTDSRSAAEVVATFVDAAAEGWDDVSYAPTVSA